MSKKLLYISTALPKEEVEILKQRQIDHSSNAMLPISIFHTKIIKGLSACYDEVSALSIAPISGKNYSIKRFKSKSYSRGNLHYIIPSFFNYKLIKQLIVFIKMFFIIFHWNFKNRKDQKNIIIDGSFFTGLLALRISNVIFKSKSLAIIVDVYEYMDTEKSNYANKLYMYLINKIDSFVFVTEYVEKLLNKNNKKFMIMEGLIDETNSNSSSIEISDFCLYAGGLHEIYGVKNLIQAFLRIDTPLKLLFYGNGDMIDYIEDISKKDNRIQYKGVVTHDELIKIERQAKILVNPRPVYGEVDTRYNFPSKLMEYMQSGRPVITTKLLGIPNYYNDLMYFFNGDNVDELQKGLEELLLLSDNVLNERAKKAQEFVLRNKVSSKVGKDIYYLINGKE